MSETKLGLLICLLSLAILFTCAEESGNIPQKRYDGDRVLSIVVPSGSDVWNTVISILNKHVPIQDQDVWAEPRKHTGRGFVMVQARYWSVVSSDLEAANIQYDITIPDVQSLITKSLEKNNLLTSKPMYDDKSGRRIINGTFPRYGDVIAWMQDVSIAYPELATTFSIGPTTQSRPMQVLTLGIGGTNKWRVWIDAGLHAREWLSPTTAIYVAERLIEGYVANDPSIMQMLQFFDFHIMPVANPDGYEYCFTGERLWRKNRRPINVNCVGVDLNRNFGFQWGGVGSESDPCSNLYRGPNPESEVEVQNFARYILNDASKYMMYYAYHTWGELFFTRWDYTGDVFVPEHAQLIDLATRAVNTINAVNGENYLAGIAPDLMYAFAGSSSDWARGAANIRYSFLTELRDEDGNYGFVAPVEEIEPCGRENWAGLQSVLVALIEEWAGTSPP